MYIEGSNGVQREDFCTTVRALLMSPLMSPAHDDFGGVRRHAEAPRDWFARGAGWILQVERDSARLYKRQPAGEKMLQLAAEPRTQAGFNLTLGAQHERRELVALCCTPLGLDVLQRVAGDEEASVYTDEGRRMVLRRST